MYTGIIDVRAIVGCKVTIEFVEILGLEASIDKLLSMFEAKLREQIREQLVRGVQLDGPNPS